MLRHAGTVLVGDLSKTWHQREDAVESGIKRHVVNRKKTTGDAAFIGIERS